MLVDFTKHDICFMKNIATFLIKLTSESDVCSVSDVDDVSVTLINKGRVKRKLLRGHRC